MSYLGKGLERLMARRLSFLALSQNILAKNQCSAVPHRSATDLTVALASDIQSAWLEKKIAGIVTVDFKGAFDGIQRGSLCHNLRTQGWPHNLIKWAASFMENREGVVALEGTTTPPFAIKCGLPQGSPVSPILFLLAIEG